MAGRNSTLLVVLDIVVVKYILLCDTEGINRLKIMILVLPRKQLCCSLMGNGDLGWRGG